MKNDVFNLVKSIFDSHSSIIANLVFSLLQFECDNKETLLSKLIICIENEQRLTSNWTDTAKYHCKNEVYYRDLIQNIGKMFGDEAYVSDDGSKQQDVLCAKVPELVLNLLNKSERSKNM